MTDKTTTDVAEIPLEELLSQLPHIPEQLVMRVAFGVPPEVEERLLSPEYIRPFQGEVKKLLATLQSQIETYKLSVASGRRANPAWHKKVGSLHSRLVALLVKVNARVKEMNRGESASRETRNRKLLRAVEAHKARVISEGYDPTDADIELWKVLD